MLLDRAQILKEDLTDKVVASAYEAGSISVDLETSGLDYSKNRIGTCQVYIRDDLAFLIQMGDAIPRNICLLLADPRIKKVFHYAMFDLRFIGFHWKVRPVNISCTKIASKILDPQRVSHSLKELLWDHLSISIDKDERVRRSDWQSRDLTHAQKTYAIEDVVHLSGLLEALSTKLERAGKLDLAQEAFQFIPSQLEIEFLGCKDLFGY